MLKKLFIIALFVFTANAFGQDSDRLELLNENAVSLTARQNIILQKLKEQKNASSTQLMRFKNMRKIKDEETSRFALPGLGVLSFITKRSELVSSDQWSWNGVLNEGKGEIFLSVTGENTYGTIRYENNMFTIEPLGEGLHALVKIDPSKTPLDEPADWNPSSDSDEKIQKGQNQKEEVQSIQSEQSVTAGETIDIMIVYTPSVAYYTADINALVNGCIQSTNDGFYNSGLTTRVNKAYAVQVSYTESGNSQTDVNRLQGTTDGYMDNVHTLRNQYGADVVVLLVAYLDYAGQAFAIGASSTTAFAVVLDYYAIGNYTFAHEVGHLLGARHDNDNNTTPYPYGHGYKYSPAYWRTIMAVQDDYVFRINYWSSPYNTYGGVPMGTSNYNDNVRVWNTNASTVAGFRAAILPLTVSIGGSTCVASKGSNVTLTANPTGGTGTYSYSWSPGGFTTQAITRPVSNCPSTWTVTVTSGTQTANASKSVYYQNSGCGCGELEKVVAGSKVIPDKFELSQNYPNPFNPTTTLKFGIPEPSHVSLKIYNVQGQEITTLVDQYLDASYYESQWDGTDDIGNQVASGIYIYRIQAGKYSESKKMLFIK